jgi:hypothetical protein
VLTMVVVSMTIYAFRQTYNDDTSMTASVVQAKCGCPAKLMARQGGIGCVDAYCKRVDNTDNSRGNTATRLVQQVACRLEDLERSRGMGAATACISAPTPSRGTCASLAWLPGCTGTLVAARPAATDDTPTVDDRWDAISSPLLALLTSGWAPLLGNVTC